MLLKIITVFFTIFMTTNFFSQYSKNKSFVPSSNFYFSGGISLLKIGEINRTYNAINSPSAVTKSKGLSSLYFNVGMKVKTKNPKIGIPIDFNYHGSRSTNSNIGNDNNSLFNYYKLNSYVQHIGLSYDVTQKLQLQTSLGLGINFGYIETSINQNSLFESIYENRNYNTSTSYEDYGSIFSIESRFSIKQKIKKHLYLMVSYTINLKSLIDKYNSIYYSYNKRFDYYNEYQNSYYFNDLQLTQQEWESYPNQLYYIDNYNNNPKINGLSILLGIEF